MRKPVFTLLIAILTVYNAYAQITVNSSDMPSANDTIRYSITNSIGNSKADTTGTNHTWDFTHLTPNIQNVDTFVAVSSTPILYQLYFNNIILYPKTKADVALSVATPALTTGLTLTDVFNYYKKPSSEYTQVGFGANINGLPTSVRFDSLDILYRFPMNYGNKDSCISKYALNIPSVMYYGQRKKRVNEVDGWGTLKTPFGNFQTLRVKSTLYTTDTIYISSLSTGFTVPRPVETNYKWIGKGSKTPLLEIVTQGASIPIVTSVRYQDSARSLGATYIEPNLKVERVVNVYPNPVNDNINILLSGTKYDEFKVELFDMTGRLVMIIDEGVLSKSSQYLISKNIEQHKLHTGIYFLKTTFNGNQELIDKLVVR